MDTSLKEKSIKGFIWNAIEKYSTMAVQFVTQLLIARQLVPEDYGVVGMISIFLGVSYIFIESGFGKALVQKRNRTQTDYSTVFYFNVSVAVIFYFILFFASPYIAKFYNEPLLIPVTRLTSLGLILNSLATVQYSIYYTNMDFKTMSIASVVGVIVSAVVGLTMAYSGFGLWALIAQNLTKISVSVIYLWIKSSWRPTMVFSKNSIYSLWPFGSKLMFNGIIDALFDNLYQVVIGKLFSKRDLGLYSKSLNYSSFPMKVSVSLLSGIIYPALCSIQDDINRLSYVYRKYIRMVSFIVFPLMFGLISVAKPLIVVLLTEKWIGIVPLIQILCLSNMLGPMSSMIHSLLLSVGRSDISLKLNIISKIITIVALVVCIPLGVIGMCFSQLLVSIFTLFVNSYYASRYINTTWIQLLSEILPSFLLSLSMAVLVYGLIYYIPYNILKVIIGALIGFLYICVCSKIFRIKEREEVMEILKSKVVGSLLRKS